MNSYKLDKNCKNGCKYPARICNQCMPPTITMKRQVYRHVDFVQFMNKSEIDRFVMDWNKSNQMKQKVGYMYGY